MLTSDEKQRVKDVLHELHLNSDINLPAILEKMVYAGDRMEGLEKMVSQISKNQAILDKKINEILKRLG